MAFYRGTEDMQKGYVTYTQGNFAKSEVVHKENQ